MPSVTKFKRLQRNQISLCRTQIRISGTQIKALISTPDNGLFRSQTKALISVPNKLTWDPHKDIISGPDSNSSEVLELLAMLAQHSELDNEEEEELEGIYLQLVFSSEIVKGPPFDMEDYAEPEFEQLFRFK